MPSPSATNIDFSTSTESEWIVGIVYENRLLFLLKNIAQFVQIISCNLPVMEITHKNALLTSGPVKKAHLKIRDGVFVPGVSF